MPRGVYLHKRGYKRKPFTIKHRENLSKSAIGRIPWNKGIPRTEKEKESIKKGQKKLVKYWLGKRRPKFSKKWLNNMSKAHKGRKAWNKGLKGVFKHKPETIEIMKRNRSKQVIPMQDTKIEVKIQNFLKELKIEFFTHHYIKEIEHSYQCDILIPSMNLVIECDGNYWHKYPIGTEIDHIRTKELLEKGFKVLRLWEIEIKEMNINSFKERLKKNGFSN